MNSGVIFSISPDWRGDALIADATDTDVVLTVKDACDFDEVFPTARFLVVGDETTPRQYIATDLEANTITLAGPVGGTGLEAGLPVVLWDPTVGTTGARSVEYIAKVELHDGSGAPDVTIPHEMIPAAGVYNLVGASVTIAEDDDGDLVIGEVLGRENVTDGAYVALDDGTSLADIYSQANAAAAAAADAAANATTAQTAANGKNKVTYSLSTPGATANAAGDIWFQKDSSTQTIIGQWIGGGGSTWVSTQLRNEVIANLDAGKLTAGSAFTNALTVKTNLTLGDASTDGVIQSYNFAGSLTGVFMNKTGLTAKGGSVTGATITGGLFRTASSGARVEISGTSPDKIRLYDSSGLVGSIYASASYIYCDATNFSVNNLIASNLTLAGLGDINMGGDINAGGDVKGARLFATTPDTNSDATVGNAVRMGASGQLLKITSAARFKSDIQPADIDFDAWEQLEVVTYAHQGEGRGLGVIADQAADLCLTRWVGYDENGEIETFKYDGMGPVLLAFAQRQARENRELREKLSEITARVEALETR